MSPSRSASLTTTAAVVVFLGLLAVLCLPMRAPAGRGTANLVSSRPIVQEPITRVVTRASPVLGGEEGGVYGSAPYLRVALQEIHDPVEAHFTSCAGNIPHMFFTETEVPASLRLTPYFWPDVATADFVLVMARPIKYVYCSLSFSNVTISHEAGLKFSSRILEDRVVPWLARNVPRWNASRGRDFIFVLGAGAGNKVLAGAPGLHDSIILSVSGDSTDRVWRKLRRVVTIPAFVEPFVSLSDTVLPVNNPEEFARTLNVPQRLSGALEINRSLVVNDLKFAFAQKRDCLGHFRGLVNNQSDVYSKGTRQYLHQAHLQGAEPRLSIKEGYVRNDKFLLEVGACLFGLCLPGHYLFTPRPVEYANVGLVPVIVGDGWHPPFEHSYDWPSVSLAVPEKTVLTPGALTQLLDSVSDADWAEMMVRLEATRHLLIWETAAKAPFPSASSKSKAAAAAVKPKTANATSRVGSSLGATVEARNGRSLQEQQQQQEPHKRRGGAWYLLAQELLKLQRRMRDPSFSQ